MVELAGYSLHNLSDVRVLWLSGVPTSEKIVHIDIILEAGLLQTKTMELTCFRFFFVGCAPRSTFWHPNIDQDHLYQTERNGIFACWGDPRYAMTGRADPRFLQQTSLIDQPTLPLVRAGRNLAVSVRTAKCGEGSFAVLNRVRMLL